MPNCIPTLQKIQAYVNEPVLKRYCKDFNCDFYQALEVWQDLMNFFWLILLHRYDEKSYEFEMAVFPSMKNLDDMWHTFLLFSKDYYEFFKSYLQTELIHHYPEVDEAKPLPESSFQKYLEFIYQYLGKDVLTRWFPVP